jgi:hypothetical protein
VLSLTAAGRRYLQQKHGNFQNVICEVAYNLMDGLKRCVT